MFDVDLIFVDYPDSDMYTRALRSKKIDIIFSPSPFSFTESARNKSSAAYQNVRSNIDD